LKDEILLVLSVDIFFDQVDAYIKNGYSLRNLELLPKIADVINQTLETYCQPKICWLVSDDKRILEKFVEKKDAIVNSTDEVGLHCLISKMFDIDKATEFEIWNYVENSIKLMNDYGLNPLSTRMAGCALNNKLLFALQKNGIKVDSSALPKRKRDEVIRFDWSSTDSIPYFPSLEDYRISDIDKSKCYKVLEVPLTTISTKTSYDRKPLRRYLDLCFKPEIISREIRNVVQQNDIVVTIIHPMQLLDQENKNELFGNGLEDFRTNLSALINSCNDFKRKIKCVSMRDLYGLF
jgi:hypothetical protein